MNATISTKTCTAGPRALRCFSKTIAGAALVVTLSIVALATVLVTALFLNVTSERGESAASSNQSDSKRLANSVVDLVKSTITQATTGYEADADGNPDTAHPTAWASQPGLIRTWNENGLPDRSFRLYSSGAIVTNGALDLAAERNELENWKNGAPAGTSYNALWSDLNAPALNPAGDRVYPIVVPPADANSGSNATDSAAGVATDNPGTPNQEGVQGFAIHAAPGYTGSLPSAANNPAPMPVKWLYVLRDGTFVSPAGSTTKAIVSGASLANPIVGRIAYWTDDETCKVNINTASEGVFWDVPYGINNEEKGRISPASLGYSLSVPVSDEYQRLPAHPSFTCLSAVLGGVLPRPLIGFGANGAATYSGGTYAANMMPYYNLVPRISGGGTQGGTVAVTAGSVVLDVDRLYANANEFLYKPSLLSAARELNNASLTPSLLSKLPFFLTVDSRAPETNLFERPRVALWPLQASASLRNAKDKLIEVAAKLNGNPFYFQRNSAFVDNDNPGSSQSRTSDLIAGGRNEQILLYLKDTMGRNVPGFGVPEGLGKPVDELLVQSFDSIRSLVNTTSRALDPFYTYAPCGPGGSAYDRTGFGSVVPIAATPNLGGNSVKGLGRFPVISEVGIQFYASQWKDETTLGTSAPFTPTPGADGRPDDIADTTGAFNGVGDPQTTQMGAIVYLVPLNVAPGPPDSAPAVRYKIEGLERLSVTVGTSTTNLNFPSGNDAVLLRRMGRLDASVYPDSGFFGQFLYQTSDSAAAGRTLGTSMGSSSTTYFNDDAAKKYPFFSGHVPISPPANPHPWGLNSSGNYGTAPLRTGTTATTFVFNGGTITIKVYPGTGNAMAADADYIQKYQVELPPATLPVPFIIRPNHTSSDSPVTDFTPILEAFNRTEPLAYTAFRTFDGVYKCDGRDFNKRLSENIRGQFLNAPGGSSRAFVRRGDVMRSVQWNPAGPSYADARIIAGKRDVPALDFAPMARYSDSTLLHVHGIVARAAGGNTDSIAGIGFKDSSVSTNPYTWERERKGALIRGKLISSLSYSDSIRPYVPASMINAFLKDRNGTDRMGDWNTGVGNIYDGPFLNKGDEGYVNNTSSTSFNIYFPANSGNVTSGGVVTSFSPMRQIASPVFFGSLPAAPWRTLLFCANPAAKDLHPGFPVGGPDALPPYTSSSPDHLFLDNFWMPVVEPYAISEPSSTAGKINLNFQLAPFTHIERSTGLFALLKGIKISALPSTSAANYKATSSSTENSTNPSWRHDLDVDATIAGIKDRRFAAAGQGFRSASEICNIYLVPKQNASGVAGPTGATPLLRYNNTANWWDDKLLTGDNLRESPYGQIYPRVTTKSNTYTVHYRVQVLKKIKSDPAQNTWNEARDVIKSEVRGCATIERFVDPNDPAIPDFAQAGNYGKNLSSSYRWRTTEQKQFVP